MLICLWQVALKGAILSISILTIGKDVEIVKLMSLWQKALKVPDLALVYRKQLMA